ncbi:MAG TPA: LuxR C-terminal-related transcriptional regulator, partial [Ktedonobacteraceae bacterium]|nr:LuxR C-terminal-related transcriptional regulator [Ktedonobacteraceae bacterium]
MTPTVQGETLVYLQNGQERELTVGTPAWFAWLETASTFSFVSEEGLFTARHERSGQQRGGRYWKAYRKKQGKLSSHYLGKSETLSLERLRAVAMALAGAPFGTVPAGDADLAASSFPPVGGRLNPLLATKLHPPRPRTQLVGRSRLVERLQQSMEHVLTLVSAPAGFGKTTLLSQWLAESGIPAAWLSLDPEDNDPARFLTYLIAALQTIDARVGTTALELLRSPQPLSPETVVTLLTNDLLRSTVGEFALVLDDYHVITAEPLHRALTVLVEHLPSHLHLILATRADPPLPLSRLRARGQLTEVRATDLRFSSEEASTFLRTSLGLDLSPADIAVLERRTEGWIAGLQLAALSLQGRNDVSAFLAAFSGSHRFVLDYLSEEVLTRQPAVVQSFLLHTSVLSRLSGPLCDAVTGQEGGQAMLEALERANLFVVALDDERGWYRYHHLFAEVLRSRLMQLQPSMVPELHSRASRWYEQHGLFDEAVTHALAVPDVERAAQLIEQYTQLTNFPSQFQILLGWLNRLPDALVRAHPSLCMMHAITLMLTHQLEKSLDRLQDVERCLEMEMPAEQRRIILAQLAAFRSQLARLVGDYERCIPLTQQALELFPETKEMSLTLMLHATALGTAANAYLVDGDMTPETERIVEATLAAVRAKGNLPTTLRSISNLARLQLLQGRLRSAAATIEQAARLAVEYGGLQGLINGADYYFILGDLLYEWNQLDSAEQQLVQGMSLVKETATADAEMVTRGYLALARLQQARGQNAQVRETLNAFALVSRQRGYAPALVAHGVAVQAQVDLTQGNLAAALRWTEASGVSISEELRYPREREYLTLVRVRIDQGREQPTGPFLREALLLLDRLLEDAEAKMRMRSVLEVHLLRALALQVQGDHIGAMTVLGRALALAEPEGYIRLFVDESVPMLTLLRQAQKHKVAPGYVMTLLEAAGEPRGAESDLPSLRSSPLLEPLTAREREVLRLLVQGLPNSAIAQELVITVGTVKRHVNSIYGKLAVNSRTQPVARAHA